MNKGNNGPGRAATENVYKDSDWVIKREARNIARVHNPHLRPGQRGCHHGFHEPRKVYASRLEEMMENFGQ